DPSLLHTAETGLVGLGHLCDDEIRRHHFADECDLRIPMGGDDAREYVAFREDSHEAIAVHDWHRADIVRGHPLSDSGDRKQRVDDDSLTITDDRFDRLHGLDLQHPPFYACKIACATLAR